MTSPSLGLVAYVLLFVRPSNLLSCPSQRFAPTNRSPAKRLNRKSLRTRWALHRSSAQWEKFPLYCIGTLSPLASNFKLFCVASDFAVFPLCQSRMKRSEKNSERHEWPEWSPARLGDKWGTVTVPLGANILMHKLKKVFLCMWDGNKNRNRIRNRLKKMFVHVLPCLWLPVSYPFPLVLVPLISP